MLKPFTVAIVAVALVVQPIGLASVGLSSIGIGSAQAQGLPDLGEESQATLTLAQESKIGEAVVRQIRAAGAISRRSGGQRLPHGARSPAGGRHPRGAAGFQFFAVGDPTINAFALPGGYIGVNTGLILLTQSESELAAVIAHEITHVTQRHMARAAAKEKNQILYMLASIALAMRHRAARRRPGKRRPPRWRRDRRSRSSRRSTSLARTNTKPIDRLPASRSGGVRRLCDGTLMDRMQKSTKFADGNAPHTSPSHPVTRERSTKRRRAVREAVEAGGRFAGFRSRARAAPQLPGLAQGSGRVISGARSLSTSTTARSPCSTGSSRRCCGARTFPRPMRSSSSSRRWRHRIR